jgi:hypothetical protein
MFLLVDVEKRYENLLSIETFVLAFETNVLRMNVDPD